jgi:hypothetical protein
MAHKKNAGKSGPKGGRRTFASKRIVNPPRGGRHPDTTGGAADQQHDAANRQGSFETKGEHARTGNPGHE